jgi:hypothetical protein
MKSICRCSEASRVNFKVCGNLWLATSSNFKWETKFQQTAFFSMHKRFKLMRGSAGSETGFRTNQKTKPTHFYYQIVTSQMGFARLWSHV